MERFTYLMVLGGCLVGALWLEPVLRVGVLRQPRRLLLTLAPIAAVFVAWDLAAIAAGHWSFDPGRVLGVVLPGGLPLEELLFFLIVPLCSVLGFEAVRSVLTRGDREQHGGPARRGRTGPEPPARSRRGDGAGRP